MKRILVACGNGIATSTVVAMKIKEKCEDNGIDVSVTQCKLLEVESKADQFDLLVTTGKFTGGDVTIPVVGAISLLTGVGEESTLDEILSHLK
ncbi:PTS system galactitol-specific IIB component [Mobilisporobacter senegalensis]|uniref:PTS system galactitol-specific IIB component n=1 Tax=Mobilisporobacter senegalensis TaxID=1329262 RepID=A0A3N1XMF1_9FIRM|nr:PTS sugar transporter subunit IIB [Mobilisporobacter senegalensis]ROR27358.1 PTS system galactitol-specific IIB component [Mobilisporobacter senegalensis]